MRAPIHHVRLEVAPAEVELVPPHTRREQPEDVAAGESGGLRVAVEQRRPVGGADILLGVAEQFEQRRRELEVAGVTVNRLCASGLNAINQAVRAIKAGEGDVYIAGGVE